LTENWNKSSIVNVRISKFSALVTRLIRLWGWRAALCASLCCLAAASFYYVEFLIAPSSSHIYGVYYGLRDSADLLVEYAILALLIAAWLRRFSERLLVASAMAAALLVLNVAFAWTSGVLPYVLVLLPSWLPQTPIIDYLAFVQFPTVRAALDFYYLVWLVVLLALSVAFFKSGLARRLVRSLEFVILILLALPIEVYLFDKHEFNIRATDAQLDTPLRWFTNADLLAVLVIGLSALVIVDCFVLDDGALRKLPGKRLME
jgi:hypothetical protein